MFWAHIYEGTVQDIMKMKEDLMEILSTVLILSGHIMHINK